MQFDDGTTTIDFFPTGYVMAVEDRTEVMEARDGDIIAAAAPGGLPPRRTRTVRLIRTAAELTTLRTFLRTNDGVTFQFTDDVGRVWDVQWLEHLESAESEIADDAGGWHEVTVELLLVAVNSDAGLEAYANSDVSQMSIQKTGATELHFPLAYRPPLGRTDQAEAYKHLTPGFLATDADRFTARRQHAMAFGGLARAFIRALEDYYVDDLKGATHPFSLVHLRDTTTSFRWTGGLRFEQGAGGSYSGEIAVVEEI